jgi:hypothetical protein
VLGGCYCRQEQTTGADGVAYFEDYCVKVQIVERLRKLLEENCRNDEVNSAVEILDIKGEFKSG